MDVLVGARDGLHVITRDASCLPGRSVLGLAHGDGRWWALVNGTSVWSATDPVDAASWADTADLDPAGTCLVASPRGLLVGTEGARLLRVTGEAARPVAAFDRAEGRERWYTPWGGPPDTRSMSEAPDGGVYVNVHVGGILRSPDGDH